MSWLYILTSCFQIFSCIKNSLTSSMYMRWLIFSCNLLSLYLAVHFPIMWLSGIVAIGISNGDSSSPWNIPLWTLGSVKLLPSAWVMYSGTWAPCRHFFSSSANLSWMVVNSFNQNPGITSCLAFINLIFLVCFSTFWLFFESSLFFCHIVDSFGFFVMFSWLPYLT